MHPISRLLALLALAALPALAASAAAPRHDLFLIGAQNTKGRVAGGRDTALNGVYRRAADGSYRHLGINYPALISASFDPRDARVFYVAGISGVFCTYDGGATWRIGTGWDITEPKDVMVDPSAPDTVYAALPDGVLVSSDRGRTWARRETGLPNRGKYTQAVTVDRTRAGRVLIGCESGIYLTENAGAAWRRVLATKETVDDVQQSPHDPQLWIAVTQSAGAQVSRDGGLTWTPIAGVSAAHALHNVAFDPTNPSRLALAGWIPGVLVSEDGGRTWAERNAGLADGHHAWRVAVDPDNGQLLVSLDGESLCVSDDFGRTWRDGGLPHSRIHDFVFVPKAQP